MRVTNEQLGAVYLEVDGLDKERFKELTKGMEFCSEHSLNYDYIENYYDPNGYQWVGVRYENLEPHSRKITLDELEQLLNPTTTPQPTHFAISPEDYAEFMKWKDSQKPKLKPIEIAGCLMEDCNDVNLDVLDKSIKGYHDYELVIKDYGIFDIIKAKYEDDGVVEEILLFGHWNDGVTE